MPKFNCPLEPKKSASHNEDECFNFLGRESVKCKSGLLDIACAHQHCVLVHCNSQLVTSPVFKGYADAKNQLTGRTEENKQN